jgi:ribosome-associated protein
MRGEHGLIPTAPPTLDPLGANDLWRLGHRQAVTVEDDDDAARFTLARETHDHRRTVWTPRILDSQDSLRYRMFMTTNEPLRRIPESELHIEFVRSSGPGGQNVNKTSTKTQLRWPVFASSAFNDEEKARIAEKLYNRLTLEGTIAIDVSEERSQLQNKVRAVEMLHSLVNEALEPEIPRIPTRPPKVSKLARLNIKRKRGTIKKLRKPVAED